MYVKLFFMVNGHCSIVFINKFSKTSYTSYIIGLTVIKSLFTKEMETTKVSNLFEHQTMLVQDTTMH